MKIQKNLSAKKQPNEWGLSLRGFFLTKNVKKPKGPFCETNFSKTSRRMPKINIYFALKSE